MNQTGPNPRWIPSSPRKRPDTKSPRRGHQKYSRKSEKKNKRKKKKKGGKTQEDDSSPPTYPSEEHPGGRRRVADRAGSGSEPPPPLSLSWARRSRGGRGRWSPAAAGRVVWSVAAAGARPPGEVFFFLLPDATAGGDRREVRVSIRPSRGFPFLFQIGWIGGSRFR